MRSFTNYDSFGAILAVENAKKTLMAGFTTTFEMSGRQILTTWRSAKR